MHPILWQFGNVSIPAFGVLLAMGFLAAIAMGVWQAKRYALPAEAMLQLAPLLMLGGLLGGKLLYLLYFPDLFLAEPLATVLYPGGLVWYGGVAGAAVVVWVWASLNQRPLLRVMDWLAPSALVGLAFGRVGCFLSGCCFGAPCVLPWAVQYPVGHPTHPALVHPAPLYESALALLGVLVLLGISRGPKVSNRRGLRAGVLLVWLGMVRFVMEHVRGDTIQPIEAVALSASQWMSLLAVITGGVLVWWALKQPEQHQSA